MVNGEWSINSQCANAPKANAPKTKDQRLKTESSEWQGAIILRSS